MSSAWRRYSATTTDARPLRSLTMTQPAVRVMDRLRQFGVATIGYAIMRSGLVVAWLRVARDQPESRTRALRYAGGMTALQALWLLRLTTPDALIVATFIPLGVAELLVPVWAERAAP